MRAALDRTRADGQDSPRPAIRARAARRPAGGAMSERVSQDSDARIQCGSDVMEAVTQFAPRSSESAARGESPVSRAQALAATATFRLSEQGRKASLLAGANGHAVQEMTVAVPTNRMHLVAVDAEGNARLKLQPRYVLNADQQVVLNDDPPIFDALPSVDDLLKEAARNHQLENAYNVERAERKRQQQDRWFELHQHIAEAFLADPKQRARVHPRPTPRQCHLLAHHSIIRFDVKTDVGIARQVPPEAYRRFCADERERVQRDRKSVV